MPGKGIRSLATEGLLGERNGPNYNGRHEKKEDKNVVSEMYVLLHIFPSINPSSISRKKYVHGNETTPQTRNSILLNRLDGTIHKSIVQFVSGSRLIHQVSTDTIKGWYRHGHEESTEVKKMGFEGGGRKEKDESSWPWVYAWHANTQHIGHFHVRP